VAKRRQVTNAPTAAARKLAGEILRDLRVDRQVHAAYLDNADVLRGVEGECVSFAGVDFWLELELRPSLLFRRRFVIGWTDGSSLAALAPGCDAVAAPLSMFPGEVTPLVLAPRSKRRARSQHFLSVLEHEFVHVNQTLMGLMAPDYAVQSSEGVVEAFFRHVRIEHEAYFVQSVRWPAVAPPPKEFTFTQWCLLRSYTPALERAIEYVADERTFGVLLDGARDQAEHHLSALGYLPEDVEWFQKRWLGDVLMATDLVRRSAQRIFPSMMAIARWLKRADIAKEVEATGKAPSPARKQKTGRLGAP
jgi:hypothetical protein